MDEVVAVLQLDTAALGVWVLGPMAIADNQYQCDVIAGSVTDSSVRPPAKVVVAGETYLDLGERQIFAMPLEGATLVIVFNERSSLGLIRLRVRKATAAIQRALAERGHERQ